MLLPKTAKADVEPIRQRTQFSCMAASMCMCLQAHGTQDCDEDTVNRVMGAKPMQGATWEQALACAQHYGMRATLMSPCTVKQLKAWTDAGTPVMIAWNPEGREWSHASVVFDVDDDLNVSVADPNIPDPDETVRVVSKDDFYKKWYEKWPDYLVRRPAMAIEREITKDGRPVESSRKASLFIPMVVHETARRKLQKKPPASTWKPEHHPRPEGQLVVRHREEEKPKSWWERVKDKFHGSDRTSEEDILEAGKKERRSIKDRGMARKIKYGPETHEEKSEGSASMERAMWEIRKQEGRAGLPGAGMGAGPHKDKSMYERKREKQVEHDASSLTQPLMTRRDYGAETMDIRDYETALKTSKFDRGVTMTLDEVARVVGPEFKEMNEDPPDSVVKVREEMQGKKADLMAMEAYADMLKDSKFEKDKPADPTVNMTPEDAAEWKRQNEEHKDEFKAAMSENPDVPFDLFFNGRQAAEKASGKWGFTKAVEGACMAGVNKLQKTASRIASNLYAKDDKSPAFLQKHATRSMSKSAAMLLKAMEGLGPMAKLTKTAGRTGMGLYGFPSKTAKLGLEACGALHHEAGEIACDIFARKGADPIKIAGFLKKNATKGKCAYSDMLGDCAPELEAELTAKVVQAEDVPKAAPKAGKRASDFMASDESEVAAIMADIMADESTSPKFLDEGDINPKC